MARVHVPEDGYLEPNGITRELARRAVAHGAQVLTGTRVTGDPARPAWPGPGGRDDGGRDPRRSAWSTPPVSGRPAWR